MTVSDRISVSVPGEGVCATVDEDAGDRAGGVRTTALLEACRVSVATDAVED